MHILDFFFPKRCVGCGKIGKYFCNSCTSTIRIIQDNEAICPVCEKPAIDGVTHPRCQTRYTPDGLTSFFRYDGIVRKAVKAMKYRLVTNLASEFVSLIPDSFFIICRHGIGIHPHINTCVSDHPACQPEGVQHDNVVFVPIPLHSSRMKERGFNQAEVLGRLVAEKLHIPIRTDILIRTRKTTPQVDMKSRKDRLANMYGVFEVQPIFDKKLHMHDFVKNQNLNMRLLTIVLFDDVFTTGATMRAATSAIKRTGMKNVWCVTMAR